MSLTARIIDDEPLARQELQYLLERAGGVEVLAQGTNGIEAVELIRTHKPDLVFLDVQMPGLDGFGGLKQRRVEEQTQAAPKANSGKVIVRAQSRLLLVDQREICFASIEEGTISVVTRTVEGQSNCRTLEELMDQLDPEAFWRAHRSYVVNIQHIREVVPWFKSSYQLRMDDAQKTEIPVSRAQTKRLRELFNL